MQDEPFLQITELSKEFPIRGRWLHAVNGVSLSLRRGECLGIVGESGCGKSTLAKMAAGSLSPTSGRVLLEGQDIGALRGSERRAFRSRIQMVFQDPASSFSPRMKIGRYLCEPLVNYRHLSKKQAMHSASGMLERVGLPEEFLSRLPHQLSGGQLQRVAIARALIISPDVLICDEATGALDVSIQNQVARLLVRLQEEKQITSLFIGHDLALVRSVSQRIAVMYLGHMVELLDSESLVQQAAHPYTKALLSAAFDVYGDQKAEIRLLEGEPPSPMETLESCPFAGRCPQKLERCTCQKPEPKMLGPDHQVACHICV
ncbi:ABC transporter ATP-binding protein [Oscillospiraceae bacterium MB08-C2-2]|nr:ABC transporter ATP-binding protein [Oscillospiraceae bacterium MB08-C2-2]